MLQTSELLRAGTYSGQPIRYVQEKLSGIRVLLQKWPEGDIRLMTRHGKTDHWPAVRKVFGPVCRALLPNNTCLDCELYVPRVPETSVISYIKVDPSKLKLGVFAVPFWGGLDYRGSSMKAALDLMNHLRDPDIHSIDTEDLGELTSIDGDHLAAYAKEHKKEGYVVKEEHYKGWYKIKPDPTVDLVVLDYKVSTSASHAGGLKALIVGYPDGTRLASVGTGLTKEFRMSCKPKDLIGKIVEVQYDSVAGDGQLKFPRFLRFREDKVISECGPEQGLYRLEGHGEDSAD